MSNFIKMNLTVIAFFFVLGLSVAGQTGSPADDDLARANEIIRDYYAASRCTFPETPAQNLSLKYNEIWTVDNGEVSTINGLYAFGKLLRSEGRNRPGTATYSRTAVLNETGFYREYSTSAAGVDIKKLDLSKKDSINDSEVRSIKREAFDIFFPITLNASWYQPIEFRFKGVAESGDAKAFVLEGNRGSGTQIKLLFSTSSKLLILWKLSMTASDGKMRNFDYHLSNYKEFSGCKVPGRIEVFVNQKYARRFEITDFQRNVKFDPKLFDTGRLTR